MTAIADILIPERSSVDPAELAAWYSGFAFVEHFRKVVLAQCRELVRAQAAVDGVKYSEAKIDDLARLHPTYLRFLENHLTGRQSWETEVLKRGIGA
jgi:hypothetical protein